MLTRFYLTFRVGGQRASILWRHDENVQRANPWLGQNRDDPLPASQDLLPQAPRSLMGYASRQHFILIASGPDPMQVTFMSKRNAYEMSSYPLRSPASSNYIACFKGR